MWITIEEFACVHGHSLTRSCLQNGSHLWQQALQKRKEGRCPLEPGEVAVILMAMGYPKETQIYVASGQVYGGDKRMAPLRNMFPNLVLNYWCLVTPDL